MLFCRQYARETEKGFYDKKVAINSHNDRNDPMRHEQPLSSQVNKELTALKAQSEQLNVALPESIFGPGKRGNIKSWQGGAQIKGGDGSLLGSYTMSVSIYRAQNTATGVIADHVSAATSVTSDGWYSNPMNPATGLYMQIYWINQANQLLTPPVNLTAINVKCGDQNVLWPLFECDIQPDIFDLVYGCATTPNPNYSFVPC